MPASPSQHSQVAQLVAPHRRLRRSGCFIGTIGPRPSGRVDRVVVRFAATAVGQDAHLRRDQGWPGTTRSSTSPGRLAIFTSAVSELLAPAAGSGLRHPQRSSGPQTCGQFAFERAPALDVERLVHRLVQDPHRLTLGKSMSSRWLICSGLHAEPHRRSWRRPSRRRQPWPPTATWLRWSWWWPSWRWSSRWSSPGQKGAARRCGRTGPPDTWPKRTNLAHLTAAGTAATAQRFGSTRGRGAASAGVLSASNTETIEA